jgi:hypothetical protein
MGNTIGVAHRCGVVEKLTRAVKELQGRAHVT